MKNLFLFLALVPFFLYGQQSFPLIKDGGVWREARAAINTPPDPWWIIKYQYLMKGDTTLNSVIYKKIYSCDYSPSISNKVFFGGIREDSLGKVYFFLDTNQTIISNWNLQARIEYLLYDFTLNIGDTLKVMNQVDSIQILQSIDSVLIGNQYRKRWMFSSNYVQNEVIEGLGCTKGLFYPLQYVFEDYQLLTCYEDLIIFWKNPVLQGIDCFSVGIEESKKNTDLITIYPNPTDNILYLHLEKNVNEDILLSIYNSLGKLIKQQQLTAFGNEYRVDIQNLKAGVYFVRMESEEAVVFSSKFIKQ